MNNLKVCEDRLRNVVVLDRRENPIRIERVLKSELVGVVKNYFEIDSDDVDLSIMIRSDGRYDLQLNVLSKSIKFVNTFEF